MTRRQQPPSETCKIDTTYPTSFVVIVAVLLFIEISSAQPHQGVAIDLPKTNHPIPMWGSNRQDAVVIWILHDGKIYFGNAQVAPSEVSAKILQRVRLGAEKKVYIHADARCRYGSVAAVIDGVSTAGIGSVAFMVDQKRPSSAAP